ncbi:MAG: hypothetical protein IJZ73_02730 [Clostridia bacterium]|nr:hypothetical protein [Clostridia bacterium]
MKKIIVNKEFLSGYKTISIVLENLDAYEIDVNDILDIYCVANQRGKNEKNYYTSDGFIKISARAKDTIDSSIFENNEIEKDVDNRLKNRLELLGGCVDMTQFFLKDDKISELEIDVPYNPLECILHGYEIELSNCPSYETDKDGNMIIAFGNRSKQPKRIDNNYAELIEGWRDAFGDYKPKILKVKAEMLSRFGEKQTNISFFFKFCDKNSKRAFGDLVFMNCSDIDLEICFPKSRNCEIVMSKMADGRIYVGFVLLGISFICDSVYEYGCYCNRNNN